VDHAARRPHSHGSCSHRHLTEVARAHCQEGLDAHWLARHSRHPRVVGGGKKRGVKGHKRQKRTVR
jgi:hypothetical protein